MRVLRSAHATLLLPGMTGFEDSPTLTMAAVAAAGIMPGKAAPSTTAPHAGQPVKRTLKLSPKGLAARKLQGQYLGTLRGLSSANRVRVKKVAREQGVAAALKVASTLK